MLLPTTTLYIGVVSYYSNIQGYIMYFISSNLVSFN